MTVLLFTALYVEGSQKSRQDFKPDNDLVRLGYSSRRITGTIGTMVTDPPPAQARARLGALVKKRRLSLGMSQQAAAEGAGLSRPTWNGIETADRATESFHFARVERVLGWQEGSIEEILNGGEPRLAAPPADVGATRESVAEWEARLVAEIMAEPMTKERKALLINQVRDAAVQYRAAEIERAALETNVRTLRTRRSA